MEENNKVLIIDATSLGYCAKGMRQFFELHNLDYLDFVHNGMDEEILIKMDDAMALAVVEEARKRRLKNG